MHLFNGNIYKTKSERKRIFQWEYIWVQFMNGVNYIKIVFDAHTHTHIFLIDDVYLDKLCALQWNVCIGLYCYTIHVYIFLFSKTWEVHWTYRDKIKLNRRDIHTYAKYLRFLRMRLSERRKEGRARKREIETARVDKRNRNLIYI